MKKHAPEGEEGEQFTCGVCNKSFPTVGKLNQHSEKHQDIRCEYCNKSFAYICTMKAHAAESCPERPGQPSQDPADPQASTSKKSSAEGPRWRCYKCSAHFRARRKPLEASEWQARWCGHPGGVQVIVMSRDRWLELRRSVLAEADINGAAFCR